MAKVGRPTMFNPEIAAEILKKLTDGATLTSICKAENMPRPATVSYDWTGRYPEFAEAYARARFNGYLAMSDELRDITDTPLEGVKTVEKFTGLEVHRGDMIEHRKLQVDTRKWLLGRLIAMYRDKQEIEHKGDINLTERLVRARKRA